MNWPKCGSRSPCQQQKDCSSGILLSLGESIGLPLMLFRDFKKQDYISAFGAPLTHTFFSINHAAYPKTLFLWYIMESKIQATAKEKSNQRIVISTLKINLCVF